jgi:hypothetical protein
MNLVTTCTEAGWNLHAKRFVDTFYEFWPPETTLYLYAEDFDPREHCPPNVIVRGLHQDCPDLVEFKAKHKDNQEAHGIIKGRYNYMFDAIKWSHRIFALAAATRDFIRNGETLINIDSDIVTFADIPPDLDQQLLGEAEIAYLPRKQIKMYSECSFVAYRMNERVRDFIATHAGCYNSGAVFSLPYWTEVHIFDWMLPRFGIKARDINDGVPPSMHPFINGELGKYMNHKKGNRKSDEHPRISDFVVTRTEPYWQDAI